MTLMKPEELELGDRLLKTVFTGFSLETTVIGVIHEVDETDEDDHWIVRCTNGKSESFKPGDYAEVEQIERCGYLDCSNPAEDYGYCPFHLAEIPSSELRSYSW